MSYANMIYKNIDAAFKQLGDLVEELTLTKTTASGFDFATGKATSATATTKIKGIQQQKTIKGVVETYYLVRASELPLPVMYDTVTDKNGNVLKIIQPCTTDGFLTTVKVTGG